MPGISVFPQFANAGGLMGYGPDLTDLFRRAANYVDRILKGARPADLPIQRPAVFKLSHQPQDRQGTRLDDPAVAPAAADQAIE